MLQEIFRLGVARLRGEVAKAEAAAEHAAAAFHRRQLEQLLARRDYFEVA